MAGKTKSSNSLPSNYGEFLRNLKGLIQASQIKAAIAVNRELIELYWDIGRQIVERQRVEGWGGSIIEQLAKDLQREFPGVQGFSARNIWRMRSFYLAYTQDAKQLPAEDSRADGLNLPQLVAEIPWGHNALLLEKVKDVDARLWYAQKTIQNGWSRAVLWHHVDSRLYERQHRADPTTNFSLTLPPPQSDLAREVIKDPYCFDFLTLAENARERDLEEALLGHVREFLLELGVGFAFLGSQYPIKVGEEEYYIDLLFYHVRLHCYVVIDLKMKEFKPEYSGKMSFYVSVVDDLLKTPADHPTIGIILCRNKDKAVAEYALRDVNKPIGISTYQLRDTLPEQLQGILPTIEQLETELAAATIEAIAQIQENPETSQLSLFKQEGDVEE